MFSDWLMNKSVSIFFMLLRKSLFIDFSACLCSNMQHFSQGREWWSWDEDWSEMSELFWAMRWWCQAHSSNRCLANVSIMPSSSKNWLRASDWYFIFYDFCVVVKRDFVKFSEWKMYKCGNTYRIIIYSEWKWNKFMNKYKHLIYSEWKWK